jgi:hypothetical protein
MVPKPQVVFRDATAKLNGTALLDQRLTDGYDSGGPLQLATPTPRRTTPSDRPSNRRELASNEYALLPVRGSSGIYGGREVRVGKFGLRVPLAYRCYRALGRSGSDCRHLSIDRYVHGLADGTSFLPTCGGCLVQGSEQR